MRPGSSLTNPTLRRAVVGPSEVVAAAVGGAIAHQSLAAAVLLLGLFLRTGSRARVRAGLADAPLLLTRGLVAVAILGLLHPPAIRWAAGAGIAALVALSGRMLEAWAFERRARRSGNGEATMVVGAPEDVVRYAQLLARHPEHGLRPVATATPEGCQPTVLPDSRFAGLGDRLRGGDIQRVLIVSPGVEGDLRSVLGRQRPAGIAISIVPPLADVMTPGVEIVDVRGLPLISLGPRRDPSGVLWFTKRLFDYAVAAPALLLSLPVLATAALAIKLDSRGPIFFRQKRVGRDGRLFEIWKLRTMVVDAEARLEELKELNEAAFPYFKMENDPRVTRVGRWLRTTCIDELPQLINVLKGDMTLVGPRPCTALELAQDPELFEWRLGHLPGITGLWQIAGRSWLPREEGLRQDLSYVEHWSPLLDVEILLRTAAVAVRGNRRPSPLALDDRPALDRTRYVRFVENDTLKRVDVGHDVSVIVVTHESADDIVACLRSIPAVTGGLTIETIVVDNASTDGTPELVSRQFPHVRLIRKARRHGFATNCNIGAVAASGRYLFFLNPDTVAGGDVIPSLAAHLAENPDIGMVGPRLVYPDGSHQPSARRFPTVGATLIRRTPLRWVLSASEAERRHLMLDDDSNAGARRVDWLLGAAVMVPADVFAAVQGMDDHYRLYCEDIDLCWRLQENGWGVVQVPSSTVVHRLGELTRKRFVTRATVWHLRSMLRFTRLHGLRPATTRPQIPAVARVIDLRAPAAALERATLASA